MIREIAKKLFNDEAGVSPIVATLVLIVVAIAGAAAVGTIMGSFSSDVSDNANAGDTQTASATELAVAGSTTVQPVAEVLAEAYMKNHPGVKISVQGGGSDAGISATKNDLVDIGMASKSVSKTDYPDIQSHTIGYSAVVVICNNVTATSITGNTKINATELNEMYHDAVSGKAYYAVTGGVLNAATTGTQLTLVQRGEGSGTEETFAKFLGDVSGEGQYKTDKDVDSSTAVGATGNQGVLDKVMGTSASLGFVDYGFAKDVTQSGFIILAPQNYPSVTEANIKAAIAGDSTKYPNSESNGLTRPLNFMTYGAPSSIEQSFINFATSPGSIEYLEEVGYYGVTQF